jgi:hypothetical protein
MSKPHGQNAGQNYNTKIVIKSLKYGANIKYFGTVKIKITSQS